MKVIIHCSTIGEATFPGRQQEMVQPNSCALTLKFSHGCFQASVRTVIRELYWKCGASDGSGKSVKTKKLILQRVVCIKKSTTKENREGGPTPPTLSWKFF